MHINCLLKIFLEIKLHTNLLEIINKSMKLKEFIIVI